MDELICEICNKKYTYKKRKSSRKKCGSCLVNIRRYKIKLDCVDYKGGKCINCGYDKCLTALSFHHLDPSEKDFNISGAHCRSWETIKTELDKCVLVCMNCHAEIHETENEPEKKKRIKAEAALPKKKPIKPKNFCKVCDKEINWKSRYCNKHYSKSKITWPSIEEMKVLVWSKPLIHLAKDLQVTDNSIRKFCKKHLIDYPKGGYWNKINAQK